MGQIHDYLVTRSTAVAAAYKAAQGPPMVQAAPTMQIASQAPSWANRSPLAAGMAAVLTAAPIPASVQTNRYTNEMESR